MVLSGTALPACALGLSSRIPKKIVESPNAAIHGMRPTPQSKETSLMGRAAVGEHFCLPFPVEIITQHISVIYTISGFSGATTLVLQNIMLHNKQALFF